MNRLSSSSFKAFQDGQRLSELRAPIGTAVPTCLRQAAETNRGGEPERRAGQRAEERVEERAAGERGSGVKARKGGRSAARVLSIFFIALHCIALQSKAFLRVARYFGLRRSRTPGNAGVGGGPVERGLVGRVCTCNCRRSRPPKSRASVELEDSERPSTTFLLSSIKKAYRSKSKQTHFLLQQNSTSKETQ